MRVAGYTLGFIALAALPAIAFAQQELLQNGGFETGDFSGWAVTTQTASSCQTDWTIGTTGAATGCTSVDDPLEGTYAAYNSFDGGGPIEYRLAQTVTLPNAVVEATVAWSQTYEVQIGTQGEPRSFEVLVTDATDSTVLGTISSQSFSGTESSTGWEQYSEDASALLSSLSGETVNLVFVNTIPENFTGPAGFGLDSTSLEVRTAHAIPTLSAYGMIFLLLAVAATAAGTMRAKKLA